MPEMCFDESALTSGINILWRSFAFHRLRMSISSRFSIPGPAKNIDPTRESHLDTSHEICIALDDIIYPDASSVRISTKNTYAGLLSAGMDLGGDDKKVGMTLHLPVA